MLIIIGLVAGIIFGALPGISSSVAVVLMLPFTYRISPVAALILLVSTYCGAIFGGSITAILFNIPGTPAAAATTFDGYPLTKKGQAGKALGVAIFCSSIGGFFSVIALMLIAPPLANIAIKFGPGEYAAIALLGLTAVAGLGQEPASQFRTLVAVGFGLLLATVGLDDITGIPRFTFGSSRLLSGIKFIPVMIGAFAGAEVLSQIGQRKSYQVKIEDKKTERISAQLPTIKEISLLKWTIIKSYFIGLGIGILPGAGATIASFVSYGAAKGSSKHPEEFGKGTLEGVAAPETANNASSGGAMVPLLTLGIPGSGTTAIILAAFLIHGLQPGPFLFKTNPELMAAVFAGMLCANIIMIFGGMLGVKIFVKLLRIPYFITGTTILVLSIIGSFALNNDIDNIWIFLLFSIIGYFMKKYKFSVAALILGLVLGHLIENNIRRALIISGFDWGKAFLHPLTMTIFIMTLLLLVWPYVNSYRKNKKDKEV